MRTCLLLIALLFSTPYAMAFPMYNSTGIDMQSASLMQACQTAAEKVALQFEKFHNINQCHRPKVSVVENSTKLSGLALDKKGFVYETFIDSGCSRSVKLEITVGPSKDGQNCFMISEPVVLGTVSN